MFMPVKDPEIINKILNHPDVYPWVCGPMTGYLDCAPFFEKKENAMFAGDGWAAAFLKIADGIYDLHSMSLPEKRGKETIKIARDLIDFFFDNYQANVLTTMCPVMNRGAIGLARICGFKKYDTLKDFYPYMGKMYDTDLYMRRRCQ